MLRMILDSLIYEDKYKSLDENMYNSNVGARKQRNIRDHLVVVPGPGGRQPEELAARALGLGAGLRTDLGCGLWGRLRGVLYGARLPHA